jgi:hypothetical protein
MKGIFESFIVLLVGIAAANIGMGTLNLLNILIPFTLI